MKNRHRVWLLFSCCVVSLVGLTTSATAETRRMTPKEFENFKSECQKDEKCANALSEIMAKSNEYKKELDAICKSDLEECIGRQKESYFREIGAQLHCSTDLEKDECEKTLDSTAESAERSLLKGPWCDENPQACEALRKERSHRVNKKISWCKENSNICQQAVDGYTKRINQRKEHNKKIKEEVSKKYAALREKREEEWFMSRAICDGKAENCIDQLNEKMEFFEKRRLEKSCKKKEEKLCERITQERANRAKNKESWCDAHKEVCEEAKNKLMAANEKSK